MEPVHFLPDYALFVSMFPQLQARPIARASAEVMRESSPAVRVSYFEFPKFPFSHFPRGSSRGCNKKDG